MASSSKVVELSFPLSGVARRLGLDVRSDKGPATTPWAVNVRPEERISFRLRGGSRSGISPYLAGDAPEWPTGELLTEDGEEIWTEDGQTILVPITGVGALYPELMEAMKAYGYGTIPETLTATAGTAPSDPSMGCMYRDRLVLAESNRVHMSRQGDYADWNYGGDVEDVGRAFFYQLSEAGELGETVTALVPHRDSVLFAATAHSLWVCKGDPVAGGTLENVSRDVGIVSSTAWTKMGDTIVFLSWDGLYSVQANGSGLKNMSGDKLPVELSDIDPVNYTIMMGYRHSESGIYIFIEGDQYHWFYDLNFGGFWPFALPTITVAAAFQVNGDLVLYDDDGLFWSLDGEDDDGTAVQSHVLFGPLLAGSGNEVSLLSSIHGAVETEPDGSVTWRIFTGDTAESVCQSAKDAVDNYFDGNTTSAATDVVASGTWTNGRSYVSHPRTSGMWIVVWLQSDSLWSCEKIVLELESFGRWR